MVVIKGEAITAGSKPIFLASSGRVQPTSLAQITVQTMVPQITAEMCIRDRALALATCGKTRLALVENGTEEDLRAAREAGYRCLAPDLDRADYALRTISNASSLLQQVSSCLLYTSPCLSHPKKFEL